MIIRRHAVFFYPLFKHVQRAVYIFKLFTDRFVYLLFASEIIAYLRNRSLRKCLSFVIMGILHGHGCIFRDCEIHFNHIRFFTAALKVRNIKE